MIDTAVLTFCAHLRDEHGFRLGPAESAAALEALAVVGIGDERRARAALRSVCCTSREELVRFDAAFDAFFHQRRELVLQRSARTRPLRSGERGADDRETAGNTGSAAARYSPAAAAGDERPRLVRDDADVLARAAAASIAALRRRRLHRWRSAERGPRLDGARTVRAALRTAGEAIRLRRLARPHRNPHIVLLVDGSRSMAAIAPILLGFGAALAHRTRHARVLLFSTELRDVTAALRRDGGDAIAAQGSAWGGGTRIGAAVRSALRTTAFSAQTVVLIASDGLDLGDPASLRRGLGEMRRRGATIFWLHPRADAPAFRPATAALRAAVGIVSGFVAARDARTLAELPSRIA